MSAIRCFRLVALGFLAWALTLNGFHVSQAMGQESPAAQAAPADLEQGKRLFQTNCSQCHGADAGGGDGPNLRGVPASLGDRAVQDFIRRGIPGTPMPASYTLSDKEAANIVAYLRTLDSTTASGKATGDPEKGKALYNSSGCPACHMIAGQGGGIGPELTRVGATRGVAGLKARLLDPGANLPSQLGEPHSTTGAPPRSSDPLLRGHWVDVPVFSMLEQDWK